MKKKELVRFVRSLRRDGVMGTCFLLCGMFFYPQIVKAQLSSNPDKFLGNITTGNNQVDWGGVEPFRSLWNQITPENATKWDACEPSRKNFTFGGADVSANYAKKWGFPFKFHTLIWGAQYPSWVNNLSTTEQTKAITEWFDGVKAHYPNLEIIDVVNEAIAGHQPAPYRAALGGEGKTGYDWIIKAFEMAHERWPDAILVYNDFNTFRWQKTEFIDLVRTLRDAGAPIDAYGCQSHDLTDMGVDDFKSAMTEIQNALKMPMYSTEYDIGTNNDALQEQRYKEQIPYMWEADYCAGVTLWGYVYGQTWTGNEKDGTRGNSGIIRDGEDRPAMTWLRSYMQSEKAKTAKSPFPGMKKEASVYIKPQVFTPTKGEPLTITVNARLRTKTIDHIDLYVKGVKYKTLTEVASVNAKTLDAAYETEYTPATAGKYNLKAIVFDTEGNKYERLGGFTAYNPRGPYRDVIDLPGTIQGENFDAGGEGLTYHDSDSQNQGSGSSYRSDAGSVDIERISSGYAVGWTHAGEWFEYTVNVLEPGLYEFDAYCASQDGGGSFSLALSNDGVLTDLTGEVPVNKTSNWSTYKAIHGRLTRQLAEGQQVLRFTVKSGDLLFNFDKIVLRRIEQDNNISISMKADPAPATVNTNTTLTVTTSSTTSDIANVKIYVDNILLKTLTASPFTTTYKPTAKGTVNFTAIATDAEGKQSRIAKYTLKVNPKRTPYGTTPLAIPGIIQAERFDKGGEGFTFHDSDTKAEGDGSSYRSDAEGVDIVKCTNGYALGYTAQNEWTEYTINVKEPGKYAYVATVSSGTTGSNFRISLVNANGTLTRLADVSVPKTGNNDWNTYGTVEGNFIRNLAEGEQILRFTITGASCNIDKVQLNCLINTDIDDVQAEPTPEVADGVVYNLAGQQVDDSYKGIVIKNGRKYLKK